MSIKWSFILEKESIPLREGRKVLIGDKEIALFNLGESFMAIDNACPHQKGPLADGLVAGQSVYCPLHNLNISLESGCALKQGEGRVKVYPTQIRRGLVYVALEEGKLMEEATQCLSE